MIKNFSRILALVVSVLVFSIGQYMPAVVSAVTDEGMRSIYLDAPYYDPDSGSSCAVNSSATTAAGNLVSGSSVFILGDSITVGAKNAYTSGYLAKGINAVVDGSTSRSINGAGIDGNMLSGIGAIEPNKSAITDAKTIVIALGTNGGNSTSSIDSLLTGIRANNASAPIFWVDTTVIDKPSYVPTIKGANEAIYAAQAAKKITSVISWFNTVTPGVNPQTPTGTETDTNGYVNVADSYNVHPTSKGATALADLVIGATTAATSTLTASWGGGPHTLAAEWIPILNAAAARFGIDASLLAGIMSIESGWRPPSFYATNPLRNSASATGAFQIIDLTATALMPTPDKWIDTLSGAQAGTGDNGKNNKSKPYTSNTIKAAAGGTEKEADGSYIADANKDGKVDRGTPEDSAFMAAALLKTLGAAADTPLGNAGDYGVAKNNSDGKITIRTVAAHYNQGGGFDSHGATTADQANSYAVGGNNVANYMDQVMQVTAAARALGVFGNSGGIIIDGGCIASPPSGMASEYISDCSANGGNAAIACTAINQLMGIPYDLPRRAAPTDPNPQFLDCSALTGMAIYRTFGVDLGGLCSVAYLSDSHFEVIDIHDIQPGDLIGKGTSCSSNPDGTGHIAVVVSYNKDTQKLITVEASSKSHPSGLRGIGGEHGYDVGLAADGKGTYQWAVRYIGIKTLQPGAK